MRALIQALLERRALVLLALAALVWAGLRAWQHLPIDAFPEISPIQAKIILKAPGMTPQEVEQRVVRPVEQELLSIPRKRIVRSLSKSGIADITLDFEEGVDIYWARQQVSERLSGVMGELPAVVSGGLAPITTPLSELYMFTIEGEGHSLAERRRVLDWVIRPALRTVPGVAEVNALGGQVQTFEVVPDLPRLAALGLTLQDLQQALAANNSNDGAGRIRAGSEALSVRVEGALRHEDDLRAIGLAVPGSARRVRLDEVASVQRGSLPRQGAVTQDGKGETVQGLVLGLRGVNARQLVVAVEQRLDEVRTRLPEGMSIHTFYNRAHLVERATGTVIKALGEAAVLVCAVLVVFLGGLRAALVVALSLPLSLLAAFVLMQQLGISANLMSLGGLAIALGMLVDASVVVVENIEAHLARPSFNGQQGSNSDEQFDSGSDSKSAAPTTDPGHHRLHHLITGAVLEVARPVVAGVLIICVVFLPLLTLQDLEGKLFSPVAMSIVLALLASLAVALVAVPVLASGLLRRGGSHQSRVMSALESGYRRSRAVAWRHPRVLAGLAVASLAAALGLYLTIGTTFIPNLDEGDIVVQLQKTPSVSLEAATALDMKAQRAILEKVPEVKAIVARAGADELGLDPMGLDDTDTFLVLKPREQWRGDKAHIVGSLRQVLETFEGVVFSFTQPIEMRISEMLTGTRGDVAIKVFGEDLDAIKATALAIAQTVQGVPGAAEVVAPREEGLSHLSVQIDRQRTLQAGFSVEALQQALRTAIDGQVSGQVIEGVARVPVQLRGPAALREDPSALARVPLQAPDGRVWLLGALAGISVVEGPTRIDHEQGQRLATIQVAVEGRDLSGFVQEARDRVAALQLPPNVRLTWGGQFENQQRAAARLAIVVPSALLIIFVMLTLTFGSSVQALLIFLNIPFALVGGVWALALSGEYLSVPASVGFIALLGIAVLNGVVMVSHFNERLASGEDAMTAIQEGSLRRLRPVLMTAVITALGMVPLLFATGPGSEIQRPLAIVVTGGLFTSTLLTLYLLPPMFARWGAREIPRANTPRPVSTQQPKAIGLLLPAALCGALALGTATPGTAMAQSASPVHATLVPWLPNEAQVQAALQASPQREAADRHRDAGLARAQAEAAGPAETSLRLGSQQRRVGAGAGLTVERYVEQAVAIERPLRWPQKARADEQLGQATRTLADRTRDEALHQAGVNLLMAWFDAVRAIVMERAAAADAEAAATLWKQTQRRTELGEASTRDAEAAQAEHQRALAALILAQGQRAAATTQFTRRYPGVALPVTLPAWPALAAWAGLAEDGDSAKLQPLLDRVGHRDHELLLARAEAQRARALAEKLKLDTARSDPTVGLFVNRDRDGAERVQGLSLGYTFAGPARSRQADAAAAEAEAARAHLEHREQQTLAQFEAQWLQLQHTVRSASAQREAAWVQASAARRTARAHDLGEASLSERVMAQRLSAEQNRQADLAALEALQQQALLSLQLHELWRFRHD